MKLLFLTALTMVAFAANSVLARLAMTTSEGAAAAGPLAYATLRIASGAVMLLVLVGLRKGAWPKLTRAQLTPALWLALYALTFAFAYLTLEAGVGALILFGMVQITMFSAALLRREGLGARSFAGAGLAFAGLVYLLWPGTSVAPDVTGAAIMALSGIGWGLYTLAGRGSRDPLGGTWIAFCVAALACGIAWAIWPDGLTPYGAGLALISGMITSALGYALWYAILPQITSVSAAVAQLTVPLISTLGGAVILSEPLSLRFALASALVLGGVALTVLGRRG